MESSRAATGYKKKTGAPVSFLQGMQTSTMLRDMTRRENLMTGQAERRLDLGFVADGTSSANWAQWTNKILSEYFTIVSV